MNDDFNTRFRREVVSKEEEIEEARASANKKVKILEQQLEQVLIIDKFIRIVR